MSARFKGVLGVIGKTTRDGRRLAPHDPALGPMTRAVPLSIVDPGGELVGAIEQVWVDGDLIRYSGRIAEDVADQVREKVFVPGMDVDNAEFEVEPDDLSVVLVGWRIVGATMSPYDLRAWKEVSMELEEEQDG